MSLNIPHSVAPPYGSMFIFELHTIDKENIVRTFYINETESLMKPIKGYKIQLPGCPSCDCPYDTFISFVANLSSVDIRRECNITDDFNFYQVLQDTIGYPDHGVTVLGPPSTNNPYPSEC